MKPGLSLLLLLLLIAIAGCSQEPGNANPLPTVPQEKVGGECEGCEAIYESVFPFAAIDHTDTLPDYQEGGPKMIITGVVYKPDALTPAPNVILYMYHTDQTGRYPQKGNEKGWGKRHGYLRGWVRTNERGEYKLYTLRPAPYPAADIPAHIHIIVKEPDINEYYIDDIQFNDDPYLTTTMRSRQKNHGGNGIISLQQNGNQLTGRRDIILGKNIANYPREVSVLPKSGLAVGDNCPAFDPKHVSGPDSGKRVCPMCKYGYAQGIMIWWNKEHLHEITGLLVQMEKAVQKSGYSRLRVFLIYMNPGKKPAKETEDELMDYIAKNRLEKIAITYIPSPDDPETAGLYKINPSVISTIFIYRKRVVIEKHINWEAGGAERLLRQLELTSS